LGDLGFGQADAMQENLPVPEPRFRLVCAGYQGVSRENTSQFLYCVSMPDTIFLREIPGVPLVVLRNNKAKRNGVLRITFYAYAG
jgi:hypothetical protein